MSDNEILDPAHDPNTIETNVGAAGIPKPDAAKEPDALELSEDQNIVKSKDGKTYVRSEALHQAREENRKYKETLAQLDPLMPEFREFLQSKQNRQSATVDRAARGGRGESEYSDDELEGLAITRGYYKDDGTTPDLARAQRELDIMTSVTRRQVSRAVQPVAENNIRDRAANNYQKAMNNRFVDGQPVADAKYIDMAMKALPPEYIADENISNIVQVIAAGLQSLDERKNGGNRRSGGRGGREPMFVERGTGRYDGDSRELSDLDLAAARARGKTPEQWAKISKQVNNSRDLE